MNRLKKTIGMLLICTLLFSGCKPAKVEKEHKMSDTTYNRIIRTIEEEKNKDAERYTTTVTMMEGIVYYQALNSYYYSMDELVWGDPDYYRTEERMHGLMWGGVIPFTEADGTVNDYIVYSLYDNDLACFFASFCDDHPGQQTTITWHYDTRGYRVIDTYDTELVRQTHLAYWTDVNQDYGAVPPVQEYDMGLTGKLPKYDDNDQAANDSKAFKAMFPDVKPYGVDYPVSE